MPRIKNLPLLVIALVFTLITLAAGPASADKIPFGPRIGYTSWDGISQFHFGGHLKLGEIFPNVNLTPGLEIGLGDGFTIVTANGDVAYQFTELTTDPWGMYAGGSLSLNYLDHEYLDGELDLGFSLLLGGTYKLTNGNEMLGEIRVGLLDSPDFKATVGYTFF